MSPLVIFLCAAAGVFLLVALQAYVRHRNWRSLHLPPGPHGLPILGSWFLFPGGAITPKSLLPLSQKYGDLCIMKLGCRNVVIVSSPKMAKEVLQSCGLQFGSRSRNFVVEMTSAHGRDMVFSNYGAHWRKVRRVTTPPFFGTEAFRCSVPMWEEEIDAAIADIASAASHKDKSRGPDVDARSDMAAVAAIMNAKTANVLNEELNAEQEKTVSRSLDISGRSYDATTLSTVDNNINASPAIPASEAPQVSSVKALYRGNINIAASRSAGNSTSTAASHGKRSSDGAVDIVRRRLHLALYNMIYRMTFNRRFESMDDPIYKELDRLNWRNGQLLQSFRSNVAEFFPPLRIFFRSFIREVREFNRRRLRMFEDVFLKDYIEKPPAEKRRSGIDFLLDAEASGEITMQTILLLFQNINVGALGITTSLMKWGIIELINRPNVQKKLHEELEGVLGNGGCLKHKDIANLPYLQAFVKEVLRMHLPVPLLVPHSNEQQEKIAGYDIPANSRILVNAWGIANDKRFWDKPEEFCPERFMGEKIDVYGSDYRFLPFGSGRRGCPGARMAFTILVLTFGKLVQSFELLPPPGVEKVAAVEVNGQFVTVIVNHLSIILKLRDDGSL